MSTRSLMIRSGRRISPEILRRSRWPLTTALASPDMRARSNWQPCAKQRNPARRLPLSCRELRKLRQGVERAGDDGKAQQTRRRGNSVFVVHGRNKPARDALFGFLRALGLQPLEWTQAIKNTGIASPDIGTILERAFTDAAAVVVLLTPDDEARLRREYLKHNDPGYERNLTGQARPNVLFEAGMAFGRNPNSTVLVQLGELRPFSDVAGKHISRLGNDATSRTEVANKLANAGCNVITSGSDWLDTIVFPEISSSNKRSDG